MVVGAYYMAGDKASLIDFRNQTSALWFGIGDTTIVGVVANGYSDPHVPGNAIDGDVNTRWSHDADPSIIDFQLVGPVSIGGVSIHQYYNTTNPTDNPALFDIYTSTDGTTWTKRYDGITTETGMQSYRWPTVIAAYIRYHGLGRVGSVWNSIVEVEALGPTSSTIYSWAPIVTLAAGDTSISLWWSIKRGGPTADYFTIEYSTNSSGPWTELETNITEPYTQDSPFIHSGLTNGTTYYYRVTTTNVNGTNPGSVYNATPTAVSSGTVNHGLDLNETNTGVLAGVARSNVSGPVYSQFDGQVIENLTIDNNSSSDAITVRHNNVTIRNCYVYHGNNSRTNGIYIGSGISGTLIEHCTLDGEKAEYGTGRDDANFGNISIVTNSKIHVRRCRMFDMKQGIQLWRVGGNESTVEETWSGPVHRNASGVSLSTFSFRGSGTSDWCYIVRCRATGGPYQATGISATARDSFSHSGACVRLQIIDNWIESGNEGFGYGMAGGYQGEFRDDNNNIRIEGNRFSGSFKWGTNGAVNVNQPGNTWSNNQMVGSNIDLIPNINW